MTSTSCQVSKRTFAHHNASFATIKASNTIPSSFSAIVLYTQLPVSFSIKNTLARPQIKQLCALWLLVSLASFSIGCVLAHNEQESSTNKLQKSQVSYKPTHNNKAADINRIIDQTTSATSPSSAFLMPLHNNHRSNFASSSLQPQTMQPSVYHSIIDRSAAQTQLASPVQATTSTVDDLNTAAGHHHGHAHGKYYEYREVPKKKTWKFGYKRGNHKHTIERHEHGKAGKHPHFKTKVKWHDKKSKGKGIHLWDYNHHDKKHYHHG